MTDRAQAEHGADLPDETLMARYARGDTNAFESLFGRYEKRAYAFFLKRTGSPERAQDLYQELFLRIHRARDRYDPTQRFAPWFFQIAKRLLVDDYRRAFRKHEVSISTYSARAPVASSERTVADRQQAAALLGSLSPEESYVILSAKVAGTGYPELAEHLGKSTDAVKKMVSRALQRLRAGAVALEETGRSQVN